MTASTLNYDRHNYAFKYDILYINEMIL